MLLLLLALLFKLICRRIEASKHPSLLPWRSLQIVAAAALGRRMR
jgi:flagellar biogenesis protein FliO